MTFIKSSEKSKVELFYQLQFRLPNFNMNIYIIIWFVKLGPKFNLIFNISNLVILINLLNKIS